MSPALTWPSRGGWRMLGLTAEQVGTVLLAIALLITGKLGHQKGKEIVAKAPPPNGETVELRGAVISDRAVDVMVKSMDALSASNTMLTHATNLDTEAKGALTKALHAAAAAGDRMAESSEANREILRANTAAASAVSAEAHDLRDVIAVLAKELEFQSRVRGKTD